MNNLFTNQGWECPKCGKVYSPMTSQCFTCGNYQTITTPSTGGCSGCDSITCPWCRGNLTNN